MVAQLYGDTIHFSVGEPEPGYILIEGNKLDPGVYSSLVDKMLEKRVERYILIYEFVFVELFLNALERRGLPTPVKKKSVTIEKKSRTVYSVEDIKTHLQENKSGGIMYHRWDIRDDCLKWIGAERKIPIIYIDELLDRGESAEHVREGNPTLFIHVKLRN